MGTLCCTIKLEYTVLYCSAIFFLYNIVYNLLNLCAAFYLFFILWVTLMRETIIFTFYLRFEPPFWDEDFSGLQCVWNRETMAAVAAEAGLRQQDTVNSPFNTYKLYI